MQFGKPIRHLWHLEEDVVFLNHGSFGACPKPVLEVQSQWREQLEREPVRFMLKELPKALETVQKRLGLFMNADADDLALVENATSGVNAVIRSLAPKFKPGDELLTTSHAYGAIRQTMQYVADTTGAVVVDAIVPFPIANEQEIIDAIVEAITPRTRLAVLDHVTSPTGVIFPLDKIIPFFKERDIPILIDGAHAPGMIDLDLRNLGVDFYTGNCHKWLYAPKGSAFLWVDKKHQPDIHPTVISHFYGNGYLAEFNWTGTIDPTAWLSIPSGIDFLENLGVENVYQYCRTLIVDARQKIADVTGFPFGAPAELLASLCTVIIPDIGSTRESLTVIHDRFFDRYRIEVPALTANGNPFIRISANVYNQASEYDRLIAALQELYPSGDSR